MYIYIYIKFIYIYIYICTSMQLFRKHDVILIQEIKSSLVAETIMNNKIKVSPKGGFEEFMTELNKG